MYNKADRNLKAIVEHLHPMRRDLVSDGYDEALRWLGERLPFKVHEFASGDLCWDWAVPQKWEVGEAWIKDSSGNTLFDLSDYPLMVPSYGQPARGKVTKKELLDHVYTLPDLPDEVPYKFFPYVKRWGFCLPHSELHKLKGEEFEVLIEATFEDGFMKVGEFEIKGESDDIIVIAAHLDHPFQSNDDLSGVAALVDVAEQLMNYDRPLHYTYRFLLTPESVGSIAYLSRFEDDIPKMRGGIFLEKVGNENAMALQYSKFPDSAFDRAAVYAMDQTFGTWKGAEYGTLLGNDEKVFNSTFVDVPMVSITRKPYNEYHSSADNPSIVKEEMLREAADITFQMLIVNDRNQMVKSKIRGPASLARNGIKINGQFSTWRLFSYLDGSLDHLALATLMKLDIKTIWGFLDQLEEKNLVEYSPLNCHKQATK